MTDTNEIETPAPVAVDGLMTMASSCISALKPADLEVLHPVEAGILLSKISNLLKKIREAVPYALADANKFMEILFHNQPAEVSQESIMEDPRNFLDNLDALILALNMTIMEAQKIITPVDMSNTEGFYFKGWIKLGEPAGPIDPVIVREKFQDVDKLKAQISLMTSCIGAIDRVNTIKAYGSGHLYEVIQLALQCLSEADLIIKRYSEDKTYLDLVVKYMETNPMPLTTISNETDELEHMQQLLVYLKTIRNLSSEANEVNSNSTVSSSSTNTETSTNNNSSLTLNIAIGIVVSVSVIAIIWAAVRWRRRLKKINMDTQ